MNCELSSISRRICLSTMTKAKVGNPNDGDTFNMLSVNSDCIDPLWLGHKDKISCSAQLYENPRSDIED